MRHTTLTVCFLFFALTHTTYASAGRPDIDVAPPAPTITGVQPTHGPADGQVILSISGGSWAGRRADEIMVTIGTVQAELVSADTRRIEVLVPAGLAEGPQDVVVDDVYGSDSLTGAYTVTAPGSIPSPAILNVQHAGGSNVPQTGVEVCIEGRYFEEGVAVVFGENPSEEVTFHSSERICAVAPYATDPTMTVINPDNQESRFTFFTGPGLGDNEDCACTTVKNRSPAPTAAGLIFMAFVVGWVFRRRRN